MIKKYIISIKLTVYTEDKAVGIAAADITSVKEATMAWATVAMATMAAIIITVAQTRVAYGEATVEEVKEDIKAFNKRNATSATNQDAGLTSISYTS
jgi:hypothetical protein